MASPPANKLPIQRLSPAAPVKRKAGDAFLSPDSPVKKIKADKSASQRAKDFLSSGGEKSPLKIVAPAGKPPSLKVLWCFVECNSYLLGFLSDPVSSWLLP